MEKNAKRPKDNRQGKRKKSVRPVAGKRGYEICKKRLESQKKVTAQPKETINRIKLRQVPLIAKINHQESKFNDQRRLLNNANTSSVEILNCNEQFKKLLKLSQTKSSFIEKIHTNLSKNWKNLISKNGKLVVNSTMIKCDQGVPQSTCHNAQLCHKALFFAEKPIICNNIAESCSNFYYPSSPLNRFNQLGQFQVWYV